VKIEFTAEVFKEGNLFVAHTPELDLSSCGGTRQEGRKKSDGSGSPLS
jgi:hypothetical protein